MSGFSFTEYESGDRIFTINAESFYLRNKKVEPFGFRIALGKSAELEGVEVIFYRDDKQISRIWSKSAIMDMMKKDIVFQGKPVLITEDKRTLSAEKIVWDNFQNKLSAEEGCAIAAGGKMRFGDKINTDIELKDFTIAEESNG